MYLSQFEAHQIMSDDTSDACGTGDDTSPAALRALEAFVTAGGGAISKHVALTAPVPASALTRGVFATSSIPEGELLLRVPGSLLITAGVARKRGYGGLELPEADLVCLVLIAERRGAASSPWTGWLPTLPRTFDVPLVWEDEEVRSLACPLLVARLLHERAEARTRHAAVRAALDAAGRGHEPPSLAEYLWARATLESRGVFLDAEERHGASQWALVPVGDMFNHAAPATVLAEYDEEGDAWRYTTTRSVVAGEELHVTYGGHDDAVLLASYGFVPRANPHGRVTVGVAELELGAADAAWLEGEGLLDPDALALARGGEDCGQAADEQAADGQAEAAVGPSWALLAALRLKHASEDERRGGAAFAILDGDAVSDACEARAWGEVHSIATSRQLSKVKEPLRLRPTARAFATERVELLHACANTARRRLARLGIGPAPVGPARREKRGRARGSTCRETERGPLSDSV